jgi:hypothetical protein
MIATSTTELAAASAVAPLLRTSGAGELDAAPDDVTDDVLAGLAVAETCCEDRAVRLAWLDVEDVVVGLVEAEPSGHSAPEVGVTEK